MNKFLFALPLVVIFNIANANLEVIPKGEPQGEPTLIVVQTTTVRVKCKYIEDPRLDPGSNFYDPSVEHPWEDNPEWESNNCN